MITYDIYENKKYKKILNLIANVFTVDNMQERQKNYVLPIETPPEKIDEIVKKVSELHQKKKDAKSKKNDKNSTSERKEKELSQP